MIRSWDFAHAPPFEKDQEEIIFLECGCNRGDMIANILTITNHRSRILESINHILIRYIFIF